MTDPVAVAPDQTVVIRNGTITAVGPRRRIVIPEQALRIDGRGKFLMPGLVDAHVHLEHFPTPDLLRLFLAHGVTTVRNMDGRPEILRWREQIARGELLGPQIVTAGPILDGAPPVLPDNTAVGSVEAAREQVKAQSAQGYDFVKVYSNLSADVYVAIAEEARKVGLPVAGHVPRAVQLESALANQASFEHLADIGWWAEADDSPHRGKWHWSKLLVAAPLGSEKLQPIATRLAAARIRVVPTLTQAARAVAPPDQLRQWLLSADVAAVPDDFRTEWERRVRRASDRIDGEDWDVVQRGFENRRRIVSALREAKVPLLVGTDTPNPFVVPGASVHEELRQFLAAGHTPAEALIAATRAPCSFLGLKCGTIEVGQRADLVITAANPLVDVANARPWRVIAAGRLLDPS